MLDEVTVTNAAGNADYPMKNANGNVITLTLKNNHLIVETEERAVSIALSSKSVSEN